MQSSTAIRILVTGSRNWTDVEIIRSALLDTLNSRPHVLSATLVHGGAQGADRIAQDVWTQLSARDEFQDLWMLTEVFHADWTKGRGAGPARNAHMVASRPDVCLAFPLGESRGTRGCMRLAEKAGIPIIVHEGTP